MSLKGQNLGNQFAKGYRHTEEAKKKISLASLGNKYKLGKRPWNFGLTAENDDRIAKIAKLVGERNIGRKASEETKRKMSISRSGSKNYRWKGGQKKCIECCGLIASRALRVVRCLSCSAKLRTGENNNMWRGGVTTINEKIRKSTKYYDWRDSIYQRDNFICQFCKKRGGKLNADHIKPFAWFPELRLDINNGRTLCKDCHIWKTKMDMKIFTGKIPELNYV